MSTHSTAMKHFPGQIKPREPVKHGPATVYVASGEDSIYAGLGVGNFYQARSPEELANILANSQKFPQGEVAFTPGEVLVRSGRGVRPIDGTYPADLISIDSLDYEFRVLRRERQLDAVHRRACAEAANQRPSPASDGSSWTRYAW